MKKTTKRILILLLILIVLILLGGWILRSHSTQPISPSPAADHIPEHVVFFRQKDDTWKHDTLGKSKYTMSDSGCLTSCLAAVFVMQNMMPEGFSGELTPGTLNTYFSEKSVYDGEGNIQWETLSQTAGVNVELKDAEDLADDELERLLSDGVFPIVKVRVNGAGSYHFVLLVSSENGEFLCMDPLKEEEKLIPLSEYGGKIYAVRYINKVSRENLELVFTRNACGFSSIILLQTRKKSAGKLLNVKYFHRSSHQNLPKRRALHFYVNTL